MSSTWTSAKPLALSLRQPWAWLVLNAGKDIENRKWKTNFRGTFFIHAAQGCTRKEYEEAVAFARSAGVDPAILERLPSLEKIERGGVVGIATLIDCVSESDSPWFFGPYGFKLESVQRLHFRPCQGRQRFFHIL